MSERQVAGDLLIVPEPTPDERQAIARALAGAAALPPTYRSAWRRSGAPADDCDLCTDPGRRSGGEPSPAL